MEEALSRVKSEAHAFSFVVGAYAMNEVWDMAKTYHCFSPGFWKKMLRADAHYSSIEEVRELSKGTIKRAAEVLLLTHLMVHERANKQDKCAQPLGWATIGVCMTKDDLRTILGDTVLSNDTSRAIEQLKLARGAFLQNARTKRHMTVREAASFIGVDRSVLEGIEKGTQWVTGKARARLFGMNPQIRNANGALQAVENLIDTLQAKLDEEAKMKEAAKYVDADVSVSSFNWERWGDDKSSKEESPSVPTEAEPAPAQDSLEGLSDEELDALTKPQPVEVKVNEAPPAVADIKVSKHEYNHQTPFGVALYLERTGRSMTAVEVGNLLNVSDNAVLRWEGGVNAPVHENYVKLCELFPALRKAQLPASKNAEKPVGNRSRKEEMTQTTPTATPAPSFPTQAEQPAPSGGLKNLLSSMKMLAAVNASPDAVAFKNLLRQAAQDNMSASEVLALLHMLG